MVCKKKGGEERTQQRGGKGDSSTRGKAVSLMSDSDGGGGEGRTESWDQKNWLMCRIERGGGDPFLCYDLKKGTCRLGGM